MKKSIILISSFFLCAHFALAQTEISEWRLFISDSKDFSIETPVSLHVDELNLADNRKYWGSSDGLYLYVFADRPTGFETDPGARAIKYAREHQKDADSARLDGKEAQQYAFEDEDGYHHRIVSLKSKGVRYVFQTVSEEKSNPGVDRFFASIRLNKSVRKDQTIPEIKPGTFSGTINGDGMHYGRGSGGPAPASTPNPGTTNVKILSKPRASYTDPARLYSVSGTVSLQITFLADGTIGEITPVTKLPFGLIGSAITAARSIRFEPARKDGVPYTKIMTIQYGFATY